MIGGYPYFQQAGGRTVTPFSIRKNKRASFGRIWEKVDKCRFRVDNIGRLKLTPMPP